MISRFHKELSNRFYLVIANYSKVIKQSLYFTRYLKNSLFFYFQETYLLGFSRYFSFIITVLFSMILRTNIALCYDSDYQGPVLKWLEKTAEFFPVQYNEKGITAGTLEDLLEIAKIISKENSTLESVSETTIISSET